MTLIAFDDTDSRFGMCTTYLMALFLRELKNQDIDIIGFPRLVRLNPNIPYKTRGNGALCVGVGRGEGDRFAIGRWGQEDILAFPKGISDRTVGEEAFSIACALVRDHSEIKSEGTDPGVVMFESHPVEVFYHSAVRKLLTISEAEEFIEAQGGVYRKFKNGRGIIGAAAACAWTPQDKTYEIISYRDPRVFGTKRVIDKQSVVEMDNMFPSTFNNIDIENEHVAIAPSSPCPVLYAIRAIVPDHLIEAAVSIQGESPQGFVIYETNQGTDDHLVDRKILDVKPYESVIVDGVVEDEPRTIPGGHVVFSLSDGSGTIECTAYEPTKQFRNIIRELRTGDEVTVCGGVREEPFTVNLEKIHVRNLVPRKRKVSNPACPMCGKAMKSIGAGQGYRCRGCGTKGEEEEAVVEIIEPAISMGWFEVPVCARRHLHKPLKFTR